jgi:hypothetical protein
LSDNRGPRFSGNSASKSDGKQRCDLTAAEDLAQQFALTEDGLLKVYSAGEVTVLGFGGSDVPSEFNAAHYRAAISDLVKAHHSTIVAFDLTGVRLVPSGMLGLWSR